MNAWIPNLVAALRRMLTQPLGELNRWQLTLRYAVSTARYGLSELREDRASQMAAALTYRTIFSLIPLFVISVLVINAFGGFESLSGDLQNKVYGYLGLSVIEITDSAPRSDLSPPINTNPSQDTPQNPNPQANNQTKAEVDQLLADLHQRVSKVSFGSIGAVGVGLLIWAAVALVIAAENCFNHIYHAPRGRSIHMRISIYWAVLTLGPVLLAGSFLMTNRLIASAQSVAALGWLVRLLIPFAGLAATWLLLLLVYLLLPNTKVKFHSALTGACVAAALWELSKLGFGLYVSRAVSYSALYGSLGLVPLFLLWLYLTWLIILFGLEISYVLQTVKDTRFFRPRVPQSQANEAVIDTAWVLPIAAAIAKAFEAGHDISLSSIASNLKLPGRAVETLGRAMCQAQLIHRVDQDLETTDRYALSRPAAPITLSELIQAARQATAGLEPPQPQKALETFYQAQNRTIEGQSLQDLLASPAT